MLMDKCCEQRPTHHLTEMDQHLVTTYRELFHSLASLNDHLACRVHAQCSQYVDNLLSVWPQTIEDS